jgi:hypothetical protein
MTLSWKQLKGDQRIVYNAPVFQYFMAGLVQNGGAVSQDKTGRITLRYSDGSEESADCPDFQVSEADSLLAIVSLVQDRARGGV